MAKKIMAALCALAVVMSTAAVLPQGSVKLGALVTASAEEEEPLSSGDFYYTVLDEGTVEISRYTGSDTEVTVPDEIEGKAVTGIGAWSFSAIDYITSITIPDSVTSIGEYAFVECNNMTSVTIPQSVTDIGYRAFGYHWDSESFSPLESFTVSGYDGTAAEQYAKDNGFEFIPLDGSAEASDFEYTVLDEGTVEISRYKGSDHEVTVPDEIDGKTVTSIGSGAFCYLYGLTSVTMPDSITSIGNDAFSGCGIKSIKIPDGVTSIGNGAFSDCQSLTSIVIPDGVTSIGDNTFWYCKSLTSIAIPDGITSIGRDAFFYCDRLTEITIPDSVKTIGESAFVFCKGLSGITIPKSVTEIGDRAFGYGDTTLDNFTISGYRNTAAEQYAKDNGFEFISLKEIIAGDCNGDGKTTMKDYSELQKYLSGWDVEIDLEAADLNGDGKVTMKDYAALQRKLNGWS